MKNKAITLLTFLALVFSANAAVNNDWATSRTVNFNAFEITTTAITEDESVYVSSWDTLNTTFGGEEVFAIAGGSGMIFKYAADGSEAWGTSVNGASYITHLIATEDDGVLAAGRFTGTAIVYSFDGNDVTLVKDDITGAYPYAFLAKYDKDGNVLWAKDYEMDTLSNSTYYDPVEFAISDIQTQGDNIVFTGTTYGVYELDGVEYGSTSYDFWGELSPNPSSYTMTASLSTGDIQGVTMIPAVGNEGQNFVSGNAVGVSTNGNYTVASVGRGNFSIEGDTTRLETAYYGYAYAQGLILNTYNSSNELVNSKIIKNKAVDQYSQSIIDPRAIEYVSDNKYIITGQFTGVLTLSATDSLQADTANFDSYSNFMLVVEDNSVVSYSVLGSTTSGDEHIHIAKCDEAFYIAGTSNDNYYLGTQDISTTNLSAFVAKYDFDGEFVELVSTSSDSISGAMDIASTTQGKLAFVGAHKGITIGDEAIGTTTEDFELFLSTFTIGEAAAIVAPGSELAISLYPNPAENVITVDACDAISIYSLSGVEVLQQNTPTSVDISALDAGVYMVKLTKDKNSSIIRLIKE